MSTLKTCSPAQKLSAYARMTRLRAEVLAAMRLRLGVAGRLPLRDTDTDGQNRAARPDAQLQLVRPCKNDGSQYHQPVSIRSISGAGPDADPVRRDGCDAHHPLTAEFCVSAPGGRRSHRVLSISDDDGLRRSRELLLLNDGYEVDSLSSDDALEIPLSQNFEIAILCQSIRSEDAVYLAKCLRESNAAVRILHINSFLAKPNAVFDLDTEILSGPRALLRAVAVLCGRALDRV